jgi:hypothetical protein
LGKKYTALHLLYHYKKDLAYVPVLLTGFDIKYAWGFEHTIDKYLENKRIICVINPFGSDDFETNTMFLKFVERFLSDSKTKEIRLIIVSISDKFIDGLKDLKKSDTKKKIKKAIVNVELFIRKGKKLYPTEVLRNIIIKHARIYRPKWYKEISQKNKIAIIKESREIINELCDILVSPTRIIEIMNRTIDLDDRIEILQMIKEIHQE